MPKDCTAVTELNPGIFQIRGLNGSSHSYVIKGDYMNVMIDSGSDQNFPVLEQGLRQIGIKVRDIHLVINSHEHCDHIGANRYFQEFSMIAAYRLAASKMIAGDYYVTMYKGNDLNEIPLRVHLWLENMTRIDLGNYSLRVFHTPGHTSGCISIIETTRGRAGGIRLAKAPEEIAVGALVRATEEEFSLAECMQAGGRACAISPACRLKGMLHEALAAFLAVLDKYTLADIVHNRAALGPLLGTLFMYYVVDVTSGYTSAYMLIVGAALILLVLYFPKGILGTIRDRFARWLP